MVTIAVRFLTGRYHATPWGRHVNEGVPEWPPSPWRLLRAIVAAGARAGLDEPILRGLVEALAHPPRIQLPAATPSATRHYMPQKRSDQGETALVMDTFMATGGSREVLFSWDVDLTQSLIAALSTALQSMPYLGRAESWCEARVVDEGERVDANCVPMGVGQAGGTAAREGEIVRVLCADPAFDGDLLDAVTTTTADLRRRQRRLDPPGSLWVSYVRDRDAFVESPVGRRASRRARRDRVEAVRFRIVAVPLPPITAAVAVGDRARWAVMASYSRLHGGARAPQRLTGHGEHGPLQASHMHAFYLPSDEDGDGRIDHLTIYCRGGFDDAELAAIRAIRRLWPAKGGPRATDFELDLLPVGEFTMETLRSLAMRQEGVLGTSTPWYGTSSTWVSATPFLLARHPKTFRDGRPKVDADGLQIDGPEAQLLREWRFLFPDGPRVVSVQRVPGHQLPGGRRVIRWTEYRCWRETGNGPAVAQPYGFVIHLDGEAAGPVALGFASHYGLGLFIPMAGREEGPKGTLASGA